VFVSTYEYLRDHLVNSTCYLIPDSEHFGPIERPDVLLGYIREFLNHSDSASLVQAVHASE
jgi:pimeloyl-ACP methyl ester carboxylesterase